MTTLRVATRRRFTQVDRATINDERLSFRARGVLVWLLDKPDGWNCDSRSMAKDAPEGRDAIRAALSELELAGYLERVKLQTTGGQWVTEVVVHERPPTPENPASVSELAGEKTGAWKTGSGKPGTIPFPTDSEEIPPTPQGGIGVRAVEFEAFWTAYPRKTDKAAARKAWGKLCRERALPAFPVLLDAVAVYCRSDEVQRGVTCHASTWLNRRRWEDEPTMGAAGPKPQRAPECGECGLYFAGTCIRAATCPMIQAAADA